MMNAMNLAEEGNKDQGGT